MAVTAHLFPLLLAKALNAEVDYDTHTIKGMLVSGYTFDPTDAYLSDIGAVEITGTGYTAGGATLGSKTIGVTAANSWATARANSTAYTAGQYVRPATGNGYLYMAAVGGTSGGSVPTWPTVIGQVVTDGGVTWACVGTSALVLDAADLSWANSTISASGLIVYDAQTGTTSSEPLICHVDFGATVSSTAATFSATLDVQGLVVMPVV